MRRWEATDGDYGRIEVRRHAVCHDIDWLTSDRRFPGEWRFGGLAMIGMVESQTERACKIAAERRSAKLSAQQFAAAVRAHWHVENRLHGSWTSSSTMSSCVGVRRGPPVSFPPQPGVMEGKG
jgi:hypothetical protein